VDISKTDVADTLNTGQRTPKHETERKGTERSEKWGTGSISEPSRQSTGEGTVLNTKSESSNKASEQTSTISKEWISRIYSGAGCWGTESRTDWSKAESRMGNQTYGISRWLAELGLVNSWGVDDQWENKLSRVRKRKDKDIDRLKALGNAVVPQFMELVGRLIIKSLVEDTLVFDENIIKKPKKSKKK
jgi:site-specific DNA-cytosine methylase